jgi:4-diphosphocytidyl-2C-methyl-D-erythritol kinase
MLTPMKFDTAHILLLFCDCQVNTAELLFMSADLVRDQSPLNSKNFKTHFILINDFMPVVLQQFPEINNIYQRLKVRNEPQVIRRFKSMFKVF